MNLVDVRLSMGVRVLCRPSVWEASITHLCAGLSGSPWLGWLHFRGQTWFQSISHRIHGAGIYTNIGAILMVNVTIYSSTMDPMGLDMRKNGVYIPKTIPRFHVHWKQVTIDRNCWVQHGTRWNWFTSWMSFLLIAPLIQMPHVFF